MKNPLVIYHKDCPDGFGAAFALWLKLDDFDTADFVAMPFMHADTTIEQFGEALQKASGKSHLPFVGRDICVLDYTPPNLAILERMIDGANLFTWLDHHDTSFKLALDAQFIIPEFAGRSRASFVSPSKRILLDKDKSGAILAWEHFRPGVKVPSFFALLDDYDRWERRFHYSSCLNASLMLNCGKWTFDDWLEYDTWDHPRTTSYSDEVYRLLDEGAAVIRSNAALIGNAVDLSVPIFIPMPGAGPAEGVAANCPYTLRNEVADRITDCAEVDYAACWQYQFGQVKVSLRSRPGFDVSKIAKAFGGGGHQTAASFTVSALKFMEWMAPRGDAS